jgi:hypothetical protein
MDTSSAVEIFRMYNGFTKQNILVSFHESAYRKLIMLYEQGYVMAITVVISGYNAALRDKRRDMMHTIPIQGIPGFTDYPFLVIAKLSGQHFEVMNIIW